MCDIKDDILIIATCLGTQRGVFRKQYVISVNSTVLAPPLWSQKTAAKTGVNIKLKLKKKKTWKYEAEQQKSEIGSAREHVHYVPSESVAKLCKVQK